MTCRLSIAALLLLLCAVQPGLGRELTIVTQDGGWESGLREIYLQPFAAATAIPVNSSQIWDGRTETLRTQLKANETGWDVVLMGANALAAGCDDGLLEKLDWSVIGGKEHYAPQAVSECGVGAFVSAIALSWDRDKFPAVPGWAEFWDVAKVPGKRGLFRGPRGTLEFALLADGVAPGDVYKQLRSADGVDRAFRRLEQLRPFIVWWETEAQAAQLLGAGDVLMTSAPVSRVVLANQMQGRNFGLQWSGALSRVQYWAIVKGSPNIRQAQQFLYFVGTPAIQARITAYGGLAKGVVDFLSQEALAGLPAAPANMAAMLAADEAFWREHGEKLNQRFDVWLAR